MPTITLISGCSDITPSSPAIERALGRSSDDCGREQIRTSPSCPYGVRLRRGRQPPGPGTTSSRGAAVTRTRLAQHYVQETWTSNGRPFFVFAPINACTGRTAGRSICSSTCRGRSRRALSGRRSRSRRCTTTRAVHRTSIRCRTACRIRAALRPRTSSRRTCCRTGATSCIVEGHQTVRGNGTPADAFVDFEFFVYSSYDGGRGHGVELDRASVVSIRHRRPPKDSHRRAA